MFRKRLRRFSRSLAVFPSLGYAAIYLSFIPLFALIYTKLPHQFYHNTVQYEKAMEDFKKRLPTMLKDELKRDFVERNGSNLLAKGANRYDINYINITITSIRPETNDIKFIFAYGLTPPADKEPKVLSDYRMVLGEIEMHVNTGLHLMRSDGTMKAEICYGLYPQPGFLLFEHFEEMFPKNVSPSVVTQSEGGHILFVTKAFDDSLSDYLNGLRGFPTGTTIDYWRMFYLSAMTITTVGYGDIVPITPLTRALVAVQAICGIIIIGLFLNALAYEANSKDD